MKRLLTFLFLLLGFILLNKQVSARQNPSKGDAFMNLPDSACWNSFASTNVFFWQSTKIVDSVDWIITGGGYNILYASQRNANLTPKLIGQKPEATGNKNALTIQFLDLGLYTIKATLYYQGTKTIVSKTIYVKDCSMATCLGQNTGVGDFLEDFGKFPKNATNSVSSPSAPTPANGGYNYVPVPLAVDFADNSYTVFWHTQIRSEWVKAYNHSPNPDPNYVGGMLIANSAVDKKTFFVKKAVPVCPGSMYNFSAWFMNVNSKSTFNDGCASGNVDGYHYAGVTFQITDDATGAVLAKFKTYDVSMNLDAPTWQEYGGAFKTPANVTAVTLSIINDKQGGCGNDIAIDDISFKYCSPYIYSFIDGQDKPPLRADSLCEGAPVTIKAVYSPFDYFTNPTYQWQYTRDTLNWPANPVFPTGVTGINTSVLTFPVGTLKGDPNQIVDYYFRVNILEKNNPSNCASPSLYTKISVLPKPKVTISSGRICIGDSVLLTANGGYSTYEWQTNPVVTGPKMTAFPTVNTTFAAIGIADYGWNSVKKEPRQCRDTGYANVIVDLQPTIDMTAAPTDICLGKQITLTQTHGGAPPDSISWTWRYNGTTIGNLSDVTLNHTPTSVGTQQYTVTVNNHTCTAADTASVIVRSVPKADVDTIYKQCNIPDFNIKRSTPPADQQGKWIFDGPHKLEVITNTTTPATTVKGVLPGDTVHLFWIITNKALAACTDTNRVTLINTKPLTISDAGKDSVQCGNADFKLNATQPGIGEKGKWTLGTGTTSADVSLDYDTAYNTTAHILGATRPKTVQLIWSISNGVCAGATSSTIKLTVKNPPTVKVSAAAVCNTSPTFTVAYNSQTGTLLKYVLDVNPAALPARKMPNFAKITGTWPLTTPAGSFTVPLPAGTAPGSYDFVLTASEDPANGCNTTVYFSLSVEKPSTTPTGVTASVSSLCVTGSTTLTVVGGSLGVDSTGKKATWKWYTGACPGSAGSIRVYPASSNADSSVVTFNNIAATTTYYVMAPSTGPCSNTACASVKVTVYAQPNTANAGIDQQACERTADFQLNGNATGVTGAQGLWTTWNSNAIITNPTQPSATVKVNIGDTATLFWTISNGPCTTTTDTVFIANFKKPIAAAANIDQKHCNDSMFTMAANKPTEYGAKGTWTAVGRPTWVTITDTTLNTTAIKVLAGHTATMVWTITNGTCAATTDTVLLTNYDIPAIANANIDQKHCNDSMFTMAANKPTEYGAYGNWTAVGRPGWVTITDTTSNTTKIKVLAGHTATMVWTITNGTCAATTDTVLLTNYD
ncbi:hypothetical protein, partial [Chitinophaga sp.]|uniref:immunoglobulin domain-containing protein n=1 Tax=Chitinophaga sp. TaxID=1869181 RepID=UPI002F91C984